MRGKSFSQNSVSSYGQMGCFAHLENFNDIQLLNRNERSHSQFSNDDADEHKYLIFFVN